jgi:hypothetical protein
MKIKLYFDRDIYLLAPFLHRFHQIRSCTPFVKRVDGSSGQSRGCAKKLNIDTLIIFGSKR